ncbi:hypothetical protein K503DRAFT_855153 [Rhizopogon vinicolor AM-OR11-026]|uniref:F-box domain-containing protein n=1 Tax=Rhizopogon vinicolor AM-OR11-026 TaxID=1314800 RepID=A0A1B7N7A3_9AGAM|nr:hypothetical protein K503DRAFT_855153 [Rhizopogon vinicolor AM-OR11-026]
MHACLLISEILKAIFAEVTQVTNGDIRPSYTTLYHLALTCRAFKEQALDALWARIESAEVLAMCLPQDARSESVRMCMQKIGQFRHTPIKRTIPCKVMLIRPLVDDDWATFHAYARRVRSLTYKFIQDSPGPELHDSAALTLLNSHASPYPLFPQLHELNWYDERDVLIPCLQRCISTTLTRLVINSEHWPSTLIDLIAGLGKTCPNMKEFRCSTPPASACSMLSDIVTCWDDLEVLKIGAVDARALQHLASLELLRELEILVPEGYTSDPTPTFNLVFALDKFSIRAQGIDSLLAFLAPLKISTKSVRLAIDTAPDAVYLNLLLSSLEEHVTASVLESLDVWVDRPYNFNANHVVFLSIASTFQGLRAFKRLTYLDLRSFYISISDDEIIDFVSTWPQMECFYFGMGWDWEITQSDVTFRGLVGILERCPNLRCLGIDLDASTPRLFDHQYTGVTREKLVDLNVGGAECNDVEAIGNLLAAMCPNLSHIAHAYPVFIDYEDPWFSDEWTKAADNWKEVQDFITEGMSDRC